MAIVVKYEVTGMSTEKYDAIMRDLTAAGLTHPDGRAYHVWALFIVSPRAA